MQRITSMVSGGRERRKSILFDATEFTELTSREVPSIQSVQNIPKNAFTSFALKRTGSSVVKVLSAFAKLPPVDKWLRSGVVERQTMSSDTLWLPRLMILTEDDIFFAREGTDLVLDQLALKNVTFISKVRANVEQRSNHRKRKAPTGFDPSQHHQRKSRS